ncbi:PACE efflux transporter [Halomonas dongshanensis]|uniref:PACE efflux transporter n=1 Tax=Halomonas dongshanensis TaxID=2890835 RepID=A0ABT2EBD7_9GAMM|nr:PACE efflux transporter [Halomonas dongshanensis]MCS2607957.1 PACE efflux transporter [Halomonas dongshanensis]
MALFALSPIPRRITYVVFFELFAIALATLLLTTLSGGEAHSSLPVAIASSLAAVVWNFIYNTYFERWEMRRGIKTRSLGLRVAHAAGFETGLVLILIPLFMWWYQVGPLGALKMELALLVFFLVFTFVFTWIFDKLVKLKPSV